MFTFIIILAIIASILLVLIVLVQNPKGGGIAANFSAANQIAGVKKTNEFVEKATWTLAIALLILSMGSGYLYNSTHDSESLMKEQLENGARSFESPAPTTENTVPMQEQQAVPQGEATPAPEEN